MIHEMKLQPEYFNFILNGTKRIEIRLNDEKRQNIKLGDKIKFLKEPDLNESFEAQVIGLLRYNSFEEMFKDYEVVVSTHQNTNHIHNHFILNSVSFKTGKKYNNNRTNLAKLRHISDAICSEYGLSVLDEDLGYKSTYNHKVLDNNYYKTLKEAL